MYNKNDNHNLDNTKKYSSQICTLFKKKSCRQDHICLLIIPSAKLTVFSIQSQCFVSWLRISSCALKLAVLHYEAQNDPVLL